MNAGGQTREGGLVSQVLAVVAAGGALIGWVAVVGGIVEYARFRAAGIPSPAQSASLLQREALIAEGLAALVPMFAVALTAAASTYVLVRAVMPALPHLRQASQRRPAWPWLARHVAKSRRTGPGWWRTTLLIVSRGSTIVALLLLLGSCVILSVRTPGPYEVLLALALIPTAWFVVVRGWLASPVSTAALVFSTLVLYGGVVTFMEALGKRTGEFDTVIVTRHGLETVSGFYLARSGNHVYVAVFPAKTSSAPGRTKKSLANPTDQFAILAIPEGQVETIDIGPAIQLKDGSGHGKAAVTQPPGPTEEQGKIKIINGTREVGTGSATFHNTANNTTVTITKTTNNNSTIVTRSSTTVNTSPPPPPQTSTLQMYATDEIVPASNHFCFPIGSGNSDISVRLVFVAPTLPSPDEVFADREVTEIAAHTREKLWVGLTPAVRRRLRNGRRLPVNVRIMARTPTGTEAKSAYHLELQQSEARPLPNGPSWEATQEDSETCPAYAR
jgi:hypothetical protein